MFRNLGFCLNPVRSRKPKAPTYARFFWSTPADIEPPLSQFQHTVFTKDDVFRLIQTINGLVEVNRERALTEGNLQAVFETFWPHLEKQLREIKEREEREIVRRPDRQLLEEILEILRAQEKRIQEREALNAAMRDLSRQGLLKRDVHSPEGTQFPELPASFYLERLNRTIRAAEQAIEKAKEDEDEKKTPSDK